MEDEVCTDAFAKFLAEVRAKARLRPHFREKLGEGISTNFVFQDGIGSSLNLGRDFFSIRVIRPQPMGDVDKFRRRLRNTIVDAHMCVMRQSSPSAHPSSRQRDNRYAYREGLIVRVSGAEWPSVQHNIG